MGDRGDLWLVDTGDQDPLDCYDHELARRELLADQLEEAGCSAREQPEGGPRARWRCNPGSSEWQRRPDPNGWEAHVD